MRDSALEEMISYWNPDEERCGLVVDGLVVEVRNYASKMETAKAEFAMRRKDVLSVVGDGTIQGIFHTHPSNSNRPSQLDIAGWPEGLDYYIVTETAVTEWKIVGSNPVLVARTGSSLHHPLLDATAQG